MKAIFLSFICIYFQETRAWVESATRWDWRFAAGPGATDVVAGDWKELPSRFHTR
jgi:hypothetical protein